MSERMLVTPLGYTLLKRKKEQLEEVILTRQESLPELTQGDADEGFRDSFLLETQMNIQRMDYELREVAGLLEEADITEMHDQTDVVSLGHKVVLTLTYPSGEREALIVVLTTPQELSLIEDHLPNGELPLSVHSALGKAIYGKKAGVEFRYKIASGTVEGQLLKIEVWQPVFSAVIIAR